MGRKAKKPLYEVQNINNEIERISLQYDIPTAVLRSIVREYGSLSAFKSQYIEYATGGLNKEEKFKMENQLKKIKGKYINAFDLNSPDLIFRDVGYCKINQLPNFTILVNGRSLIEKTDERIEELPENWADILKNCFGLKKEEKNCSRIAQEQGSSRQNINELYKRARVEYDKKGDILQEVVIIKDKEKRDNFIEAYFKNNDMFYNQNTHEQDEVHQDQYQSFLNNMIIQVSNIRFDEKIDKNEYMKGEGVEKILNKIEELRNNINIIMNNSYFSKDRIQMKAEIKLLQHLEAIKQEVYKYRLQEEYLSNDYRELVELLTEIDNIEKTTQVIDKLNLAPRTFNALKRNGINTLQNLTQKNENDLVKIRGLGKEMVEEIREKVHEQGFLLQNEEKNNDMELSKEIQELQIRYEALRIKTVESERQKKILESEVKKLKLDKINGAQILQNFDNWFSINAKKLNTMEDLENIYRLRDEIQFQLYSKKALELKYNSELAYVDKRIKDFKNEKEKTYNEMTEIEI